MQEVEGRAEDPPPSELSVGIKLVECRIHKKEVGITDVASRKQSNVSSRSANSNCLKVRIFGGSNPLLDLIGLLKIRR